MMMMMMMMMTRQNTSRFRATDESDSIHNIKCLQMSSLLQVPPVVAAEGGETTDILHREPGRSSRAAGRV